LKNYKIIIIDDDADFANVIRRLINNYDVDVFTSSLEGIKAIEKNNYDVLVLDYFIDNLDGEEVVKFIRERNHELYIMILTGFYEEIPGLKALKEIDIQDYCIKDVKNLDSIIIRIESAVKSVEQLNKLKNLPKEESFPVKLKMLREARRENQQDLAEILGVSRTAISGYESGRNEPGFEILKLIAKHYKVSIDYLLNTQL
jgi:DNA-binding response OmpR family regulator